MKKFLLLAFSLFVLLDVYAQSVGNYFTENGIEYKITNTSPMEVAVEESDYSGDIAIPQEVVNNSVTYKVTSIGDYAFLRCSSLTSITIPSSVTTIGKSAFSHCSSLTSITIPNSVTIIGESAFSYCSSLTSITIPSSVTTIRKWAFNDCSSLASITILEGVATIGESAFSHCSSLTSITIPSSVTTIGDYAFKYCKNLASVTILEGVATIGDYAFVNCSSLTSITIPSSVTTIGESAFSGCNSLTSVTIPSSVTTIREWTFSGCSGLTSITIPEGVTSIERCAFPGCSSLASITIPSNVTTIKAGTFEGCSGLTSITIPNNVTEIGYKAFSDCSSLTSITIPNNVTEIGDYAFNGCSGLETIIVNKNNSKYYSSGNCLIEKETNTLICGCKNSIIPSSVITIKNYAFERCSSLTSITIPSSVTIIKEGAFSNCSGLTSITIPSSVTTIENRAFYGCSGLETIIVDEKNPEYYSSGNCLIEKGTNTLIRGCKNSIIPNSVTTIEYGAFSRCSSLTSITIPSSVKTIGYSAFSSCSGLTSITIPSSVTIIGNYAFSHCSSLTSITIPSSVTIIKEGAFSNCSGLTSITIPEGVTTIGEYTFRNCSNLKKIVCLAKETPTLKTDAFYNVYLDTILVPINSVDVYKKRWSSSSNKIIGGYVVKGLSNNDTKGVVNITQPIVEKDKQTTLTAIATEGYHFTQWSDGNTENTRTITVISDTTFTAEFAINIYNVSAADIENGSVAIEGEYKHGSTITLTATAAEGYHFTQWSDGNTENPRTVTVVSDVTFTAEFEKNTEQNNQEGGEVAISDNEATKLLVYPSPATSVVTIDGIEPNSLVKVYNINGAMVVATTLDGNSLNVTNLAKGTYIIETENGTIARFVKQ